MENENEEYYKAYDKRYGQVYLKNMLWSSKEPTPEVLEIIQDYKIGKKDKILDLGCGEGRDAIYLLDEGYNILALDYSQNVINKCNELCNNKYENSFKQFDFIKDTMDIKFRFIYSIAVLHMFVIEKHRINFLDFIYEHLDDDGIAFISVLGDGIKENSSEVDNAFNDIDRIVMNNNTKIKIASTSCKIVNWDTLEKEVERSNLKIEKKWISNKIPEFSNSMCIVVKRQK